MGWLPKSEMTADSVVSNPAKENIRYRRRTTQWHLITMQHVVHMPRNHVCIDRWRSNFLPINYINFIGGAVVVTSSMIYMQKQMLYVSWGAHMKFFKLRSNKIHQEQNNNNNNKSEDREKKEEVSDLFYTPYSIVRTKFLCMQ